MTKVLIIGGTAEAKNLHFRLQEKKLFTILSYAGLTESIDKEIKNIRVGGFGGATGMSAFIKDESITNILDASHPFSKNITVNFDKFLCVIKDKEQTTVEKQVK